MQDSTTITPFWNRIPQFFLYPLKPTSLVLVLMCSFLTTFISPTLFGLLLCLTIFAAFTKYGYFILVYTAQGHRDPPPLSADSIIGGYSILFKQLFIFILIGLIALVINNMAGSWAMLAYVLLAIFFLPASIMLLAITERLANAVNMRLQAQLVYQIGWPYLILYAFLFFLDVGSETAIYFLDNSVSPKAQFLVITFVSMYFGVIMYHMMGYVIYQYHEELGYDTTTSTSDGEEGKTFMPPVKTINGMDIVDGFIAQEKYEAAAEELKSIILEHPGDIDLRLKFHRLVKLTNNIKQLTIHGAGLITRLMDFNRLREAIDVYLDCVRADPAFRPEDKEQFLPIARFLREQKCFTDIIQLISGFHKTYPDDDNIPDLYLLVAQVFTDDLKREDKAKQILSFLSKRFPDHPIAFQVSAYQNALAAK